MFSFLKIVHLINSLKKYKKHREGTIGCYKYDIAIVFINPHVVEKTRHKYEHYQKIFEYMTEEKCPYIVCFPITFNKDQYKHYYTLLNYI